MQRLVRGHAAQRQTHLLQAVDDCELGGLLECSELQRGFWKAASRPLLNTEEKRRKQGCAGVWKGTDPAGASSAWSSPR